MKWNNEKKFLKLNNAKKDGKYFTVMEYDEEGKSTFNDKYAVRQNKTLNWKQASNKLEKGKKNNNHTNKTDTYKHVH